MAEAGYSAFVQAWDVQPGANFIVATDHAVAQAERTIAVLSPVFLNGRFTAAEWAAAFARGPMGQQRLLVPVRVRS